MLADNDSHVAILMGVAEVLAGMQEDLKGVSNLYFSRQRKDWKTNRVDSWGAKQMVEEGSKWKMWMPFWITDINSQTAGRGHQILNRAPSMAAVDNLEILVKGRQAHGAYPGLL